MENRRAILNATIEPYATGPFDGSGGYRSVWKVNNDLKIYVAYIEEEGEKTYFLKSGFIGGQIKVLGRILKEHLDLADRLLYDEALDSIMGFRIDDKTKHAN